MSIFGECSRNSRPTASKGTFGIGEEAHARSHPIFLPSTWPRRFILALNWRMEGRGPRTPKEINEMFRALIVPTLTAAMW
jgi:hypothetical protein